MVASGNEFCTVAFHVSLVYADIIHTGMANAEPDIRVVGIIRLYFPQLRPINTIGG